MIDAAMGLTQLLLIFGPGITLTVWAWAIYRLGRRITDRRQQQSTPAAPDNQPGTDTSALWTCRRILRATETRKEKPKP